MSTPFGRGTRAPLDWESDPRLAELSHVLRSLGTDLLDITRNVSAGAGVVGKPDDQGVGSLIVGKGAHTISIGGITTALIASKIRLLELDVTSYLSSVGSSLSLQSTTFASSSALAIPSSQVGIACLRSIKVIGDQRAAEEPLTYKLLMELKKFGLRVEIL
ncbi:hypothetical protein K435DRAFT_795197 [Dendrothele bispora CBS 962.96]|uniref:Uncharacterized protein n=1 Tax=Dendrothele bispora (strain CBS 962.96) TaxID=1314807 RepID=A0A4S8M9G3_DENBC|nr:hypothetical protein K435DRAFT_795197 [Dendrothele bispora CBS 962.96]